MQSITYSNKIPLYINSDIPDENKGNASDFNDIKSVVNANATECGNASNLATTTKTSLVDAINEVNENEINDRYYKVGDNITLPYYIINGFITSATTEVVLSLKLQKSLAKISTISVTSFNAELRGISGYLNSTAGYVQYVGLSGYTVSAYKESSEIAYIKIVKSSAFTNTSNNTPVSARAAISLTFN